MARIDRLKDELVSAEEFRRYAERLVERAGTDGDASRAAAAREVEFAGIYADHDRLLEERGALDFGDLVMRAFRLLHERPHVRERVASATATCWWTSTRTPTSRRGCCCASWWTSTGT